MKMYVEKGPILPGEESEAKKNQTKENQKNKKDLLIYLTTGETAKWVGHGRDGLIP